MSGFSDTDLAAIIAAHPNRATATLTGGSTIDGIFVNPAKNVAMFDGSVNTLAPAFNIRRSDAAAKGIDIDSALTINSQAYTVIDTDERNDGMVSLALSKS